jgi:hypothetical protein
MMWLLACLVVVGLPLLGLLAELAAVDLRRTQAVAEAALRHENEDP